MLSWIKFHFTFSFYPLHLSPFLLEDLDTPERKTNRKPSILCPAICNFTRAVKQLKDYLEVRYTLF